MSFARAGPVGQVGRLCVHRSRGRIGQLPGRLDPAGHVGQHELDPLHVDDPLAELLALGRVGSPRSRALPARCQPPGRQSRGANGRGSPSRWRTPLPLRRAGSRPGPARRRSGARRWASRGSPSCARGAARRSRAIRLDDERAEALASAGLGIGHGEDRDQVGDRAVGDEALAAAEEVVVAVALARIRMPATSLPALASVRPNAAIHSPLASRGK